MASITLSLTQKNILCQKTGFTFRRANLRRFEWIALLTYQRILGRNEGWVSLEQIQDLPRWRGMKRHHAGTVVTRYCIELRRQAVPLVEAKTPTRGPYRLRRDPFDLRVDVTLGELARFLELVEPSVPYEPSLREMHRFLNRHLKALLYLNTWKLAPQGPRRRRRPNTAIEIWMDLARNEELHVVLRLLSYVFLMKAADDFGDYAFARTVSEEAETLLLNDNIPVFIRSRAHFARALVLYRKGDHAQEEPLLRAGQHGAASTPDAFLTGMYLTRRGLQLGYSEDALAQFRRALLQYVLVESYERAQDTCYNIGRILQSVERTEAVPWLKLAIDFARKMKVGTSRIMTEILLSKLGFENGNRKDYLAWRREAVWHAQTSQSGMDRAWCNFLYALDYHGKNQLEPLVEKLVDARKLYLRNEYDSEKLDGYFARRFGPDVWERVLGFF